MNGIDRVRQRTDALPNWRASGLEEKYLETFCLVEALELQLEQRLRQVNG